MHATQRWMTCALAVGVSAIVLSCFSGKDPLYCESSASCGGDRPVCDVIGDQPGSGGLANTCVANSFPSCDQSADCTTAGAPICSDDQCWPCDAEDIGGSAACEALRIGTPFCVAEGESAGSCAECEISTDCDGERPICSAGTCLPCTEVEGDLSCRMRGDGLDICAATGVTTGRCVECTSDAACTDTGMPICNDQGVCSACADHEDCGSGICDSETGACVSSGDIVYVDGDGTTEDSCGTGPETLACRDLADGLAKLGTPATRIWLRIASGSYAASGANAVVLEDRAVRVVGDGNDGEVIDGRPAPATRFIGDGSAPTVTVGDGATVTFDRVELRGGTSGLSCVVVSTGSEVGFRRSVVEQNDDDGITTTGCDIRFTEGVVRNNDGTGLTINGGTLELSRARVTGNAAGGISLTMAGFSIVNNFIHGNGNTVGTPSLVGGIKIEGAGGNATLEFNTIARNGKGDTSPAAGVDCELSSAIDVDSNIVWGNQKPTSMTDVQISGLCNWSYSLIQGGATGTEIVDADPLFIDADGEDFHIAAESPAKGAADPSAGLAIDFDGDERPTGGSRDIGADEI